VVVLVASCSGISYDSVKNMEIVTVCHLSHCCIVVALVIVVVAVASYSFCTCC